MKTAIQGNPGSFHHIVARHWYGHDVEIVCKDSFRDVMHALESGEADSAVMAIENSLYGSFTEVYDLLQHYHYPVVGEVSEHIHQNLIAHPGTKLSGIHKVYSQYMALAQCEFFLDNSLPQAERIDFHDTAGAVEYIKNNGLQNGAAVASALAAELHDMEIIQANIEDNKHNFTRFLVIEPNGQAPPDADKASLVITTTHKPGALFLALGVFVEHGCNLTKLQSHPVPEEVWQYQFYIDTEIDAETLPGVIAGLEKQDCTVRLLGHYKASTVEYED